MTADAVAFVVFITLGFTAILYLVWNYHQRRQQWQRKCDQEELQRGLLHELERTELASIKRHTDLQHRLNEQHRILEHLARRLS
jgi:hypothetical protein